MIEKILDVWLSFGTAVAEKYINLPKRWLMTVLLPVYVVYALLYELVLVSIGLTCAVKYKLEGSLTFTESFNAFKQGIKEGLEESKG